jgi:cytochrome c oxidase subunit 2
LESKANQPACVRTLTGNKSYFAVTFHPTEVAIFALKRIGLIVSVVRKFVTSRRLKAVGLGASVLLLTSACTLDDFLRMGLPEPASEEGPIIESLWTNSWLAAWIVGIFVWGLMFYAIVRFRQKNVDDLPEQVKYNLPIEILYTVAPLVMIVVLAIFTWQDQEKLTNLTDRPTQTVGVVGFRWSWTFNYLDEQVYEIGTPGERPVLYLPIDETVRFELTSPDVIHGFWVPAFYQKMDVVPGRTNKFEVTPNKLGTYAGKCTELCGVDHARMLFEVKVVTRAEFDAYTQELRDRGQTGILDTGRTTDSAGVTE